MSCNYDKCGWRGCESCEFTDCVRDDIEDDPQIKEYYGDKQTRREKYPESYARADERWRLKKQGVKIPPRVFKRKGRELDYQREYRLRMSDEQKKRYLERQKAYQRAYRERKKNELSFV